MRRSASLFALSTAALAVLLTACGDGGGGDIARAAPAAGAASLDGISARGVGTVRGRPDMLTVVLGVETRAAKAADALAANHEHADALIRTLKERGVEDRDIQTSGLSIHPTYDEHGQRITGYQVHHAVTAVIRDLDGAGALIDDAAASAGDAVRISHLGFSIDDDGALKAGGRAEAVQAARAQATQLAEAAGVRLGRLRAVTEVSTGAPGPYPVMMATPAAEAARAAPIEPGTQEVVVMVDVVYDITS